MKFDVIMVNIKEMARMEMIKEMIKEMILKKMIRLFIEKVLMIKWKEIRLKILKRNKAKNLESRFL